MRKPGLFLTTLLLSAAAQAQWTKGHQLLGGSIYFTNDEHSNTQNAGTDAWRSHSLLTSLYGGTLLRDNLAGGIVLSYAGSGGSATSGSRNQSNGYGAGFFVTRYFPVAGRFSFLVTGEAGYSHNRSDDWSNDQKTGSSRNGNAGIALTPGLAFRMTRHLYLNGGLAQFLRLNYSVTRRTDWNKIMKRITLIVMGLLCAILSNAQLQKGRGLIGGAVNFGSGESSYSANNAADASSKTSSVFVAPFGGIFLRDNLLAGLSFNYGHAKTDYGTNTSLQSANFESVGGGFLLRRYFSMGSSFYFYVNGALNYEHSTSTNTSVNLPAQVFKGNTGTLSVSPGVAFAFGKRIVLETSLSNFLSVNYSDVKSKYANGQESSNKSVTGGFGAGGSLPLNIGFNIMLGK
ncbi:MAG: hypothetical protein EOO16_18020 [Chitinophagaceae bacterium]|nr:MAG: hypothetical protein EOO16_18020 [Chitinophagaceae bacterium]